MSLNAAGLKALMDDGNEAVVYAALGSGTTSGTENSTARVLLTLGTPTTASPSVITVTNVPLAFTGTPAASVTNVLLFSASTAGTFYGNQALTGDSAYNATGDYQITALTVTATAV